MIALQDQVEKTNAVRPLLNTVFSRDLCQLHYLPEDPRARALLPRQYIDENRRLFGKCLHSVGMSIMH